MPGPDSRTALISELGLDRKSFQKSNLILKNGKGLLANVELGKLRGELMSFAKNPEVGIEHVGAPPKKPDTSKLTPEDAENVENEYMNQLGVYNMAKMALTHHVPPEDMMAINDYLEPFEDTLMMTPAVKGIRFKAFTKNVEEPQGGLAGMFGGRKQQSG